MTITKIVITGGPSAGKSTAMSWIQNAFSKLGYTVLFVPETATEFITGGVAPWTCGTNFEYQRVQMALQLEKERLFEQAARTMKSEKILIVCDRGALDNKAYMTDEELAAICRELGTTEEQLLLSYAAVFHLVSAAKGAEEFYTFANNAARYETVNEAVALDDRLIAAWQGHPHHYIIDNSVELKEKLKKLLSEIRRFLGEPDPPELERKFLIAMPDRDWLERQKGCRKVEIEQVYLPAPGEERVRIRKWVEDGKAIYYKTRRRRVNGHRLEVEERLTQQGYLELVEAAGEAASPLKKTRYTLPYDTQLFSLDVYPFWPEQAVVKLEVSHSDEEVRLPPELQLIREVTGEENYKDYVLACAFRI